MTMTPATDHAIGMIALDDPKATDPAVAGAKGAGLARLLAAGFPVPEGVVLPVGVASSWPDGAPPGELRAAVAAFEARLDGPLAVRTSATWEDGATSAHAGATATVLDVRGVEATLAAIRHCLDASVRAAHEHGTVGDIAIVVQRLIPAEWAGVAFSADPVTGDRDVVRVAATAGLGEALVQGDVIGTDVCVRDGDITGDLDALPAHLALRVAEVAREVEDAFGRPQDIEWAFADDTLWLVQARPITALPVEPALPTGNNWQKDTAHYPEPLTPFGWSVLSAIDDTVRSVFDEMGLLIRGLEQEFVGGEVYGRVLPAFGGADSAGKPPPAFVLGLAARLVPELRRRNARAGAVIRRNQVQCWVDEWNDRDRDELLARGDELDAIDLTGDDPALADTALADHMTAALTLLQDGQRAHFHIVMAWAQRIFALNRLVGERLGWSDTEVARMLAGHSPATRAGDDALDAIRRRIRERAGAVDALERRPGQPIEALIAIDANLADAVARWIADHGWASVNYDAGVPVLAERPRMVTRLLLADPDHADHLETAETTERARTAFDPQERVEFDRVLAAARAVYPLRDDTNIAGGDRPLAILRGAMLAAGRRLAARGEIPAAADAAYLEVSELQAALRSPGSTDLVDRIARRRGEEAWVRANPGPAYVGEQAPPPDTSRLPAALRAVNEPILWVVGHEYPAPVEPPADPTVLMAGVAASPGVVEGNVRIIHSHGDLDRLADGEILVCQVTSPAWAPLFPLASAIIADGGGVLSHAAIAAREHAIPAVLGTATATASLRDGQRVRVDGTRGLVSAVE